ncbi:hypothetical protein I6B53_09705 [Schaalia sp. 19OD2882]|uniref:hypothetical protein n=1 Tax=Schaalia sp. 19OD2882 TaxID=2794089 RepID=UPI001C1EB45D|nr:hypothetical protein [Schaalia sp. 19OD2882]QWW19354.1 hypothetical protein I6B53_09705 [Schaalia sp. 19OD2882]
MRRGVGTLTWGRIAIALRLALRAAGQRPGWLGIVVLVISLPVVITLTVVNVAVMLDSDQYHLTQILGPDPSVRAVATRTALGPVDQDMLGMEVRPRGGHTRAGRHEDTSPSREPLDPMAFVSERDHARQDVARMSPPGVKPLRVDRFNQVRVFPLERRRERVEVPVVQVRRPDLLGFAPPCADELSAWQALVPRDLLERWGLQQGATVQLVVRTGAQDSATTRVNARIVGIAAGDSTVVVGVGTIPVSGDSPTSQRQTSWLLVGDTDVTWDNVRVFNDHGYGVVSRAVPDGAGDPENALPRASTTADSTASDSAVGSADTGGRAVLGPSTHIVPRFVEVLDGQTRGAGRAVVLAISLLLYLTELVLLAMPVFFTFQRVMNPSLALMATIGARPADRFAMVTAFGAITGVLCGLTSLIGTFLATWFAAERLGVPLSAGSTLVLVGSLVVPQFICLVAALWPALSALRTSVVAVIHRRRHLRSRMVLRSPWFPVMLVAGLIGVYWAQAAASILGVLLFAFPVVGGLIGSLPWLLTGWRHASDGRFLSWRLGLRETVRNGHRSLPAMAAIVVVMVISVGSLVVTRSLEQYRWNADPHIGCADQVFLAASPLQRDAKSHYELLERGVTAVEAELGITSSVPVRGSVPSPTDSGTRRVVEVAGRPYTPPTCRPAVIGLPAPEVLTEEPHPLHVVDDGAWLALARFAEGAELDAARAVLGRGGVLVPEGTAVDEDGTVQLEARPVQAGCAEASQQGAPAGARTGGEEDRAGDANQGVTRVRLPALALDGIHTLVLSPRAATALDVPDDLLGILVATAQAPTPLERPEVEATVRDRVPGVTAMFLAPDGDTTFMSTLAALATVLGVLMSVLLVLVTASVESREDMDILDAVGADVWAKRRMQAAQVLILCLHTIPLAVLVGVLVSASLVSALAAGLGDAGVVPVPILPLEALVALAVLPPLLAAGLAMVVTPRRVRLSGRRW